jgi:predicted alpha/beta-fold hydrolase
LDRIHTIVIQDFRTLWPYARYALRMPVAPEPEVWGTELEDPHWGTVRITGHHRKQPGSSECVLLAHGLGGSSGSYYALRGAAAVASMGMDSLAISLRGSDRLGEDFYNIALFADLVAACGSPELAHYDRIYALGYSMGGYVTMHFARNTQDPRVKAAVTMCTPLDLKSAQVYIDSKRAWFYRHHCLNGLKSIYEAVAKTNPERVPSDNARVQAVKTVWEWDDLTIAPRYGYDSPEHYYEGLTLRRHLGSFKVPTMLVASDDDPIIPPRTIRPFLDSAKNARDHGLQVKWVSKAGHLTFPTNLDLGFGPELGIEPQILQWFRQQ